MDTSLNARLLRAFPTDGSNQPDPVELNASTPFAPGAAPANAPGSFSAPGAIYTFFTGIRETWHAYKLRDADTFFEAGIQVISQPFTFAFSVLNLWHYLETLLILFNHAVESPILKKLTNLTNILGSIVCLIQLLYESVSLKRIYRFRERMNYPLIAKLEAIGKLKTELEEKGKSFDLSTSIKNTDAFMRENAAELKELLGGARYNETLGFLKTGLDEYRDGQMHQRVEVRTLIVALDILNIEARHKVLDKKMEALGKLLEPTETQQAVLDNSDDPEPLREKIKEMNFKRSARIVQPWLALEVRDTLPDLRAGLENSDPNVKAEAYNALGRMIQTTDEQTLKITKVHIIGIIALGLTLASFIFVIASQLWTIALILSLAGGAFGLWRYVYGAGVLDSRGEHFSYVNLIPNDVRSIYRISLKIFKELGEMKKKPPEDLTHFYERMRETAVGPRFDYSNVFVARCA